MEQTAAMEIRNPIYLADGRINCEVNLPDIGWVPYTASADDIEPMCRDIHAAAVEMVPAPFVPALVDPVADLAVARASMALSRLQIMSALHMAGLLDAANAAAAAADFTTNLVWTQGQVFSRSSTVITQIATALTLSDTALDDLFRAGAALTF